MLRPAPAGAYLIVSLLASASPASAVDVHAVSETAVGLVLDEFGANQLRVEVDPLTSVPAALSVASEVTPGDAIELDDDLTFQSFLDTITDRIGSGTVDPDVLYQLFLPVRELGIAAKGEMAGTWSQSGRVTAASLAIPRDSSYDLLRPEIMLPSLATLIVAVGLIVLAAWLRRATLVDGLPPRRRRG